MARSTRQPEGKVAREYARSKAISRKLAKVAPDEDPAVVAGAIVLFAAEVIKASSESLLQARSYHEGMRVAIDKLLVNAFQESKPKPDRPVQKPAARKRRRG